MFLVWILVHYRDKDAITHVYRGERMIEFETLPRAGDTFAIVKDDVIFKARIESIYHVVHDFKANTEVQLKSVDTLGYNQMYRDRMLTHAKQFFDLAEYNNDRT